MSDGEGGDASWSADPTYRRAVADRPDALYSSVEWLTVLERTYAFQVTLTDVDGALVPVVFVDEDRSRAVTVPFSDTVHPLGARVSAERIGTALGDLAPSWTVRARKDLLLPSPPPPDAHIDPWAGIDIRPRDEAWAGLRPRARRKVRLAERSGVTVRRTDDPADLDRFFALHVRRRKHHLGLLAQPRRFFDLIWSEFDPAVRCWLLVAEQGGEAVAATMLLAAGEVLFYKFNASDEHGGRTGANYLLLWEAMVQAAEQGFRHIDLGLSPADNEGLLQFKDAFCTTTADIVTIDRLDAASSDRRAAVRALARDAAAPALPDALTTSVSDAVYGYLA